MSTSAVLLGLPKCVAFQSKHNGRYLRYVANKDCDEAYKLLQMDGEDAVNPYTRFQVQPSVLHEGLVHIRCCHNHKYWVPRRRGGDDGWWLVADADEPEEDLSKPSCTLIELVHVITNNDDDAPTTVRFRHAHLGRMLGITAATTNSTLGSCMRACNDDNNLDAAAAVTVLNLSPRLLPEHVAFKSAANSKYLSARVIQRFNYLQFASDDIGDSTVQNRVVHGQDGTIRVHNAHFGMFWRRSPNWIWADASASSANNADTRFQVLQLGDVFALRNMGNARFCVSLTADGKQDCLNAASSTISALAQIQVEEAVLSREIYNVVFRVDEARIYGNRVLTLLNETAANATPSESTKTITSSYTTKQTSTWDSSLQLKLGVTVKFRAGAPFIANGGIEISSEFTSSYNWGESIETTETHQVSYTVPVPAMTRTRVRVIASEASCDVPFSYNQRDVLTDGRVVNRVLHDGLYTGVNVFDIQTRFDEEPL